MIDYINLVIIFILLLGVITGYINPVYATIYTLSTQLINHIFGLFN